MRGTTLVELLNLYRSECRISRNAAHNTQSRDAQVEHIQRVQTWLWEDFTWPHLRIRRTMLCADGQRYYDTDPDMDIDQIEKIEFRSDGRWLPLVPGIDAGHYASIDSDMDVRSWPVMRWQLYEGEKIEVWPIANDDGDAVTLNGAIRFTGIKKLTPLVADSDRADLDDRMIILFCAAEHLAASGAKDAQIKLDLANARYAKMRGNLTKRRSFNMFGVSRNNRVDSRRSFIAAYRPPVP